MEKTPIIFYGIDPSFRKGGFSECCIIDNVVHFTQCSLSQWIKGLFLSSAIETEAILPLATKRVYAVENSNKQGVSFDKTGNRAVLSRKSRNVGMNQAASQLTVDLIRELNPKIFTVFELSAKEKGKKLSLAEFEYQLKARKHKLAVSLDGRGISQDKRDAYKMAVLAKQMYYRNQ